MAPLYDLTLMLDPAAPDDRRAKIVGDAETAISAKGTLEGKHAWGNRTMTFEIDHKAEAEYHLLQFTGTPELLEQLQRTLRVTDGVMRFRIIKLKPGTPAPPSLAQERPATSDAPSPEAPAPEEAASEAPSAESEPAPAEPAEPAADAPAAEPAADADEAPAEAPPAG